MSNIARIKNWNISNGSGVGVSVYLSGCHFHCKGCFNSETWDPAFGTPFTEQTMQEIMEKLGNPHIDHLSILGGEPLDPWNIDTTEKLIENARTLYPSKAVWLWTGYNEHDLSERQRSIASKSDFVTFGPFLLEKRNIKRKYSGSENQYTKRMKDGEIIEDSKPSQKGKEKEK